MLTATGAPVGFLIFLGVQEMKFQEKEERAGAGRWGSAGAAQAPLSRQCAQGARAEQVRAVVSRSLAQPRKEFIIVELAALPAAPDDATAGPAVAELRAELQAVAELRKDS